MNRLNKTKVVREVDHEAERIERVKAENAEKRAAAAAKVSFVLVYTHAYTSRISYTETVARQRKADADLAKAREAEKAARSYDLLFTGEDEYDDGDDGEQPKKSVREQEEDFM